MSLAHIRLVRVRNEDSSADYRVESPDLNDSKDWAELGTLALDKRSKRYDFFPSALWIEKKGIPPAIYALDKVKQKELLAAEYPNHGWGAWAMIMHHYAMNFMDKASYPERYPKAFFPHSSA